MKLSFLALLLCLMTSPLHAQQWKVLQKAPVSGVFGWPASVPVPASVPKMAYHPVLDFLHPPKHIYISEVPGVAVDNSNGNVYIFSRVGGLDGETMGVVGHPLMEFDKNGKFIDTIGDGLYSILFPHSIRFDRAGNLWMVDDGSSVVAKFVFNGVDWRPVLILGRRPNPFGPRDSDDGLILPRAASDEETNGYFDEPTDVAVGLDGRIYVSDGYVFSRIQMFDKNGKFIKTWGRKGTGPGEFNTPHAVIVDSKNLVYVADRTNARIQIFDPDGNYLREWVNIGHPWSMCIPPDAPDIMYIADGSAGRILKVDLNGHILGWWGGGPGMEPGQFNSLHSIACGPHGDLYTGETRNSRLQKFVLDGR